MIWKALILAILAVMSLSACAGGAKPEFRGAWVTAWDNGYLTPAEADETIRMAKMANLNALMIQVRKTGDAYYNSNFEPRASNIAAGYDPLAYLIEKAHKEGIEVHAWINTFRVATRLGSSNPKHVANLHPDWVTKDDKGNKVGGEGLYLDPGVPEAQDWTYNVFMDIVKNYDIDGIHFDYVRYPGRNYGYADAAVARFNQEKGRTGKPDPTDPVWSQWRRDQVTAVVRRIYKAVKETKPKVRVSASVIARSACPEDFSRTEPYIYLFQNWAAWTKEGIVDAIVPMNYHHGQRYTDWVDGMKRWRADRQAFSGICIALNLGSKVDAQRTVDEVKVARTHGADGTCGFFFNAAPWREPVAKKLREQVFQEPASTPDMPWSK